MQSNVPLQMSYLHDGINIHESNQKGGGGYSHFTVV